MTRLNRVHYYFKLDPNIRNDTEVLFGKMEIEGLINQEVKPVKHFYDVLKSPPMSYFDNETVRIQDYLLNLRTVYGKTQGYYFSNKLLDLTKLIERLSYTREIYVCLEQDNNIKNIGQTIFPHGVKGKNFQVWASPHEGIRYCLFRIITNMFFLEQLNNVILCSVGKTIKIQTKRMDQNIERLIFHIMENIRNYVPRFPKDYNWKEFEDFVDEPNEITLYLTQFYGPPYKAKFHPRMIRALLNFAGVTQGNITGDFMLGSGTLAIESVLLNLATKGSDINPLTEIVTNAKIDTLAFDQKKLLVQINNFMANLSTSAEISKEMSPFMQFFFKGKENLRNRALLMNKYIEEEVNPKYKDFFRCALASVISDAFKKKNESDINQMMNKELRQMWKIVYCFEKVKEFLHVSIGEKKIITADIRKQSLADSIGENQIDLIITSPPYSTAIDYVKMDLPQLLLLDLIDSPKELDEKMMGTHRKTSDLEMLSQQIKESKSLVQNDEDRFQKIPLEAQKYILNLKKGDRLKTALRCYKFLYDMWDALNQMYRVLKPDGKCIIIIGNNFFKIDNEKREFRNGDFLEEMAQNKEIGFEKWHRKFEREYSKSSYGTILKEDIIFLKKPKG